MKKLATWLLAMLVLSASVVVVSCKTDDDGEDPGPGDPVGETITVKGSITTATTWKAANKYILEGFVYVDNNAILTIEPGTIIQRR